MTAAEFYIGMILLGVSFPFDAISIAKTGGCHWISAKAMAAFLMWGVLIRVWLP